MRSLTAVEIKAFVPARDFDLSKRLYTERIHDRLIVRRYRLHPL